MISRGAVIVACSAGVVTGLSYAQWLITSPGYISDTEWRLLLLVAGPCMVVILCAYWVGNGRPPVDTRRDTYTESENRRVIRPPWS